MLVITWQDYIILGLFLFLATDTVIDWDSYHSCQYPIQIFLILTYSLFVFHKLLHIIKFFFYSATRFQKIVFNSLSLIVGLMFIYCPIQGLIWQNLNDKITPHCIPKENVPSLTWFWIFVLFGKNVLNITLCIYKAIRWWRIRQYRRRIQRIVDDILFLHSQQSGRIDEFLLLRASLGFEEGLTNPVDYIGLSREDLNKIPKKIFANSMVNYLTLKQDVCPICVEDFQIGEEVSVIPLCKHIFHPTCVEKWLEQNPLCPMCRKNVREGLLSLPQSAILEVDSSFKENIAI